MWNVFVSLFVCYTHNMPQIHSFTASPFGSRCFGHQEPRCCALKLDSKSRRIRCCNTAANKKTSLDTSASISILHQLNVQVVHSYARTLAFVLCNPTIPRAESVHKEVSWLGLNLLRYTDAKHHCWMPHLAKKTVGLLAPDDASQDALKMPTVSWPRAKFQHREAAQSKRMAARHHKAPTKSCRHQLDPAAHCDGLAIIFCIRSLFWFGPAIHIHRNWEA
jgi:hypothetical protein